MVGPKNSYEAIEFAIILLTGWSSQAMIQHQGSNAVKTNANNCKALCREHGRGGVFSSCGSCLTYLHTSFPSVWINCLISFLNIWLCCISPFDEWFCESTLSYYQLYCPICKGNSILLAWLTDFHNTWIKLMSVSSINTNFVFISHRQTKISRTLLSIVNWRSGKQKRIKHVEMKPGSISQWKWYCLLVKAGKRQIELKEFLLKGNTVIL